VVSILVSAGLNCGGGGAGTVEVGGGYWLAMARDDNSLADGLIGLDVLMRRYGTLKVLLLATRRTSMPETPDAYKCNRVYLQRL